jgi:uncharacterized lipoprotein YajG
MLNRIFAASALLLLCAPAAAQEAVSMAYDAKAVDAEAARLAGACAIALTGVADQRNNKETVGSDYKALLSRDPVPWVGAALGQLRAYGYTVAGSGSAKPGEVALHATLRRAYTFTGPMRINGVVALDARITTASGKQLERKYRASGSKINVNAGTDEFMTTLNYAINNLLAQLAVDLQQACAAK